MLNKTKITGAVCAVALAAGIGIPALAETTRPMLGGEPPFGQRMELTEEQQAEMEARRAEMETEMTAREEKWNALTDAQKEEIYSLNDQIADLEGTIADKYVEFGLMDEEEAAAQKERIVERKTQMREEGFAPMCGGFGGSGRQMHGRGFMRGEIVE